MSPEALAYQRHMNLKLAAEELQISWHTLYSRLKAQGIAVVGDKLRYGSDRDKLAAMAEKVFLELVPSAKAMNTTRWQTKWDFEVGDKKVDVKASMPRQLSKRYPAKSWAFSFKKQSLICDFICCFCFSDTKQLDKVLLVPKEFFEGLQTISVSCNGISKWTDYEVNSKELSSFFNSFGLQP